MIFDNTLTPRLWVKRLVIFESLHPVVKIRRDISLKRGLNLIVGKPTSDQALLNNPMAMAGHSVGKTTFCRLLRYCLGEDRFATKNGEKRIRTSLPLSWVGAEVEIESVPWAVLLPLGVQEASPSAQENVSIEDLISASENGSGFYEYRRELGKLIPPYVHHPEITYRWEHLLGWLTRDQECRLRKFEVWRDSDSDSGTPGFRKRREHPVHLVRGMLDLLVPEESEWHQKHTNLVQQQKQLEEEQHVVLQEAEYAYRESSKNLAEFIGEFEDTRKNAQLSFNSPSELVKHHKNGLSSQYEELEKKLGEAERNLFREKRYVTSELERKKYVEAMLAATPKPERPEPSVPVSKTEKNKQKLDTLNAEIEKLVDCRLANSWPLKNCVHINEFIADLKKVNNIINLDDKSREQALQKETNQERTRLQGIIKQLDDRMEALKEAQNRVEAYESERKDILAQLSSLDKELDRLERAFERFDRAEKNSIGNAHGTEVQKAKEGLEQIDSAIYHAKDQLDFYRAQSAKRDEGLQNLFNMLVQRVLKANYSGSVITSADDFCPQILQGSIHDGAAIESLSFILLDIAAVLGASQGVGTHPGFLLHDSPREADLSIGPYHSLLIELAAITEEIGGEDNAPFQYIVTTTTEPPSELTPLVRLPLAAYPKRKLLFRQQLGNESILVEK